jgi:hypothetical protein
MLSVEVFSDGIFLITIMNTNTGIILSNKYITIRPSGESHFAGIDEGLNCISTNISVPKKRKIKQPHISASILAVFLKKRMRTLRNIDLIVPAINTVTLNIPIMRIV